MLNLWDTERKYVTSQRQRINERDKCLKKLIGKHFVTKGVDQGSREIDTNPGFRRDWCLRETVATQSLSMHLVFIS